MGAHVNDKMISAVIDVDNVDAKVIPAQYWRMWSAKADVVANFLTEELALAGCKSVIESDGRTISVSFNSQADHEVDPHRLIYCVHLIQVGLLADPTLIIGNTVYNGGGAGLAQALLTIDILRYNKYLAERDCLVMVKVAPFFTTGIFALALIRMRNKNYKVAIKTLESIIKLNPKDWMALKYLAISSLKIKPGKAWCFAESAINVIVEARGEPDVHTRLTYGMALRAAGMNDEAENQFRFACGFSPLMTPDQWAGWGWSMYGPDVDIALSNPTPYELEFNKMGV
jgi:tetratricopeptide (TPR) repeat protein